MRHTSRFNNSLVVTRNTKKTILHTHCHSLFTICNFSIKLIQRHFYIRSDLLNCHVQMILNLRQILWIFQIGYHVLYKYRIYFEFSLSKDKKYIVETYLGLIIPCTTTTLISQTGVLTISPTRRTPFTMIPHLLRDTTDQRNCQTHSLSSANSSNAMHIIGLFIRQSYVYHWKDIKR